jgi:orotidine-5'-phosphate decarboxylase
MSGQNPICVALDTSDASQAAALARGLKPHVGYFKVGMELFFASGSAGYQSIAAIGVPIFLDLKLHDIPHTVAQGLKSLIGLSPSPAILNVHASGGLDMMKAAKDAVGDQAKLIAVTVLTSLSDEDVWAAGFDHARSAKSHARSLAELALAAGLDGVVCSPHEIEAIRHATTKDFLMVVPGIRPAGVGREDQKRVATPDAALRAGANILVIGRPITSAVDPVRAVQDILAEFYAR